MRGWDIVAVARVRAAGAEYSVLREDFLRCVKALGLMLEAAE